MEKNTTVLIDPENPSADPRKFTFDYSYWSHDGFKVRDDGYCEPTTPKYCDQVHQSHNILENCYLLEMKVFMFQMPAIYIAIWKIPGCLRDFSNSPQYFSCAMIDIYLNFDVIV